jgi:hypothetical protein
MKINSMTLLKLRILNRKRLNSRGSNWRIVAAILNPLKTAKKAAKRQSKNNPKTQVRNFPPPNLMVKLKLISTNTTYSITKMKKSYQKLMTRV